MPKRAANVLTLVSAVVCAGSVLFVARSFLRLDSMHVGFGERNVFMAIIMDAQLFLRHHTPTFAGGNSFSHHSRGVRKKDRAEQDRMWRNFSGVRWVICWGAYGRWERFRFVILPLWLVPLLAAILPVRWGRTRRRDGGRGFPVAQAANG